MLASGVEDFDWSLCRTFLAVARHGSIAAATAELGISHPAVRRQLERLEDALGAPLFSRSQTGMAPTPLAVALLEPAENMERSARSMLRQASSTETTGLVRIAADGLLAAEVLPAVFRSLRHGHPGLHFEVVATSSDVIRRDADVGIHLSPPRQDRVVTSRLVSFRSGLFASPDWLEANGMPLDPGWFAGRRALIGQLDGEELRRMLERAPVAPDFAVTVTDQAQILPLVAAGVGVGSLPLAVALRQGSVERLLATVSADQDVWLSVHPDLRQVPHVRLVMDALRHGAAAILS